MTEKISIKDALALARRYAVAIAEGRIEAKDLSEMSDEALIEFDEKSFDKFSAKQNEAEELAKQ